MGTDGKTNGWVLFAAVLLLIAGAMNVINGLFAITKDQYFNDQLLFANLGFWGAVYLVFGVLQALAGVLVLTGRMAGGWLGMSVAVVGACIWVLFLFAFPFGALIGIALNVLVIYGLTVYASERRF
jgi:hypothetical protein